ALELREREPAGHLELVLVLARGPKGAAAQRGKRQRRCGDRQSALPVHHGYLLIGLARFRLESRVTEPITTPRHSSSGAEREPLDVGVGYTSRAHNTIV